MKTMESKKYIPIALLSGFFWSVGLGISSYIFFSYPDLSPFLISFIHDFFSIIFLGLVLIIKDKKINLKIFSSMKNYSVVVAAILSGPLGMQFNLYAIKYLGANLTSSITAIYPALAIILSVFFLKNKVGSNTIFGVAFIVLGLFIQTYQTVSGKYIYIGVLFGFLCALSWASESILSSYAMSNELKPLEALFIRQITSFITYTLLLLLFSSIDFSYLTEVRFSYLIIFMVASNMLSYMLYYLSIKKLGASKATGLNVSYVVWTVVISAIFLNTAISIKTMLTSIIIIIGVYIIVKE